MIEMGHVLAAPRPIDSKWIQQSYLCRMWRAWSDCSFILEWKNALNALWAEKK